MSFSSPTVVNPAELFFEFKSAKKGFYAYDRNTKDDVAMELTARFIVLDTLSCITGYSDKYACGAFSNEVHSLDKEPLSVRTFKGGYSKSGYYKEIKDEISALGLNYTKSLYVLLIAGKRNVLCNIKLSGSALNEWIDAKLDTRRNVVVIENSFVEKKKGATVYSVPVFSTVEMPDDLVQEAIAADKILQQYFKDKKALGESEIEAVS